MTQSIHTIARPSWLESCEATPSQEGTLIRQVTSAPRITHNIYCEQPYVSSNGNRFLMFRTDDPDPSTRGSLLVHDIDTYRITRLEPQPGTETLGPYIWGIANAAYSGIIFVVIRRDDQCYLVRWNLETMERDELFEWDENVHPGLQSVSPDSSFGLAFGRLPGHTYGIYRVDLSDGSHELIYENPDIFNPHLQLHLKDGSRTLVQDNRGSLINEAGVCIRAADHRGIGLYSIAMTGAQTGADRRDFPVGCPFTASTTGHASWVGETDRVVVSLREPHNDGTRRGNMVEASYDNPNPRVVFDSPHTWIHVSISRCGRFLITDTADLPGMPIIVVSIATGKWRILCEARSSGGGGQYTHAHPYMTPDNKWVVFNSDRTGLAQVYIARIPEGFLDELES